MEELDDSEDYGVGFLYKAMRECHLSLPLYLYDGMFNVKLADSVHPYCRKRMKIYRKWKF